MGGFLRVRDGLVVEHGTYGCHPPFGTAPGSLATPIRSRKTTEGYRSGI